jgi:2-amino-4-hydroxy-6-hydroxymethyldihydropteridine diphosphokinase
MRVVLALGANLGEPRKQIADALIEIGEIVTIEKVSSLYETEPFQVLDEQPKYINAVLIGDTDLQPKELIHKVLEIEAKLGRRRSIQNAARTIDIDIVDYEGFFMQSDELTLPHPRAHERRFVLQPWVEIDPDAVLREHGPIKELLAALS